VYYAPRLAFDRECTLPTVLGAFSLMRSVIVRERIQLVHAHQAFSTLAHEAVLHARTMRLKTVFTDHSLFGFADGSSIHTNKLLQFTLCDTQQVVCVSHTRCARAAPHAVVVSSRIESTAPHLNLNTTSPSVFTRDGRVLETEPDMAFFLLTVRADGP